ncbi:hypothetical protein IJZ97_06120, partial [bacterium]|nr:hypothetical protein [bacterium]
MNNFDLGRMMNRFINYRIPLNNQQNLVNKPVVETFVQNVQQNVTSQTVQTSTNLQMNTLQSMDRAIYAREVMQLPKNMNELVFMIQKGLTQAQFNQMFSQQIAAQKNALSQQQAQILAQLQGLVSPNQVQTVIQSQMASQLQASIKNLTLSPNGMIDLVQISQMLQINGKEALTKLITSMTQASKQGIQDLSQIKEMAKLVNASVATAAQNDPAQTLKVLLMLYLPWLPLSDGVGFDLDIESSENSEESDSILTITISTVNFGVVVATLVLETSNSVHVSIDCSKEFPKEELLLRINGDEKQYSMNSVVTFSECEAKSEEKVAKAKINMSQTTEINPFMLLMAHTIIRHVIEIDNNMTIGVTSH